MKNLSYHSAVGSNRTDDLIQNYIMKNEITHLAISLGLIGTAAYLLSRVHPAVTADSLVGYGVVLALLATAALDYRVSWKSLIKR